MCRRGREATCCIYHADTDGSGCVRGQARTSTAVNGWREHVRERRQGKCELVKAAFAAWKCEAGPLRRMRYLRRLRTLRRYSMIL